MTARRAICLVKNAAFIGLAAFWFLVLRPQWLGGPALYIFIRGDSMLPVHSNGDLVVVMARQEYAAGDAVAYQIPAGDIGEGHVVVHRIVEETDGRYVMQGDNNPSRDPSRPLRADLRGRVELALPGVGQLIATALSPVMAGGLAAALVVMLAVAHTTGRRVPAS